MKTGEKRSNAKKKLLLDAYAVFAWIQDEPGAQSVEDLLYQAQGNRAQVLISVINLGEIYYRCARVQDLPFARDILEKLKLLPVKTYPCPDDLVLEASEIKAQYPISYADAFAVATALREDAGIVTGDPDFKKFKDLVAVEWL